MMSKPQRVGLIPKSSSSETSQQNRTKLMLPMSPGGNMTKGTKSSFFVGIEKSAEGMNAKRKMVLCLRDLRGKGREQVQN